MLKLSFLSAVVLFSVGVYAQPTDVYEPIEVGAPPSFVYQNPLVIAKNAAKTETVIPQKYAYDFHLGVSRRIWESFTGGKVYFDGPITNYVQAVAKNVLETRPELYTKLKVYAVRSSAVNAFTYADGHIFINIGLLNALESEDELAFIIAHEAVHFAKDHSRQSYLKLINNSQSGMGSGSDAGDEYRLLKYSRENELEADAAAVNVLMGTKYNAELALKALEHLEGNADKDEFVPDFKQYFDNELFTVNNEWVSAAADSLWVLKADKKKKNKTSLADADEDIFQTHPDIEKRVLALGEILKASEYKAPAKTDNKAFESIQQAARYETVYNTYTSEFYNLSLYYTLKFLNDKPNDAFLQLYLLKNLYMLGYLRGVNKLEKILLKSRITGDKGMDKTNSFLSNLSISDLKKMGYGYMKTHADELSKHEEFAFYRALLTDTYLGKEAAASHYNQYAKDYPKGKYITIVKDKLKSVL